MDLGTIATQLGDFDKFVSNLVDFLQGIPGIFAKIGEWAKPNDIIADTSSALLGTNRTTVPVPGQD
ncbi:PorH family porin [Corynebacterium auris]|uniref:PorH family porin n=1 Tax=Corynebacterium auris TaxID=44750 RepID=UPI0025B2AECC|nr:PorH family porin [Corynebacterium auris]WJY68838.1 hypothetical protein CAURIS_09820 [Corynebacterium auris]